MRAWTRPAEKKKIAHATTFVVQLSFAISYWATILQASYRNRALLLSITRREASIQPSPQQHRRLQSQATQISEGNYLLRPLLGCEGANSHNTQMHAKYYARNRSTPPNPRLKWPNKLQHESHCRDGAFPGWNEVRAAHARNFSQTGPQA